jgi:superfamily II DNA or RNA helicase
MNYDQMLRPYQQQGKDEIYEAWRNGYRRVMYQLVTGGGKSLVFTSIARDVIARKKKLLFLVHREELINQAHKHFYRSKIVAGIIKSGVKPTKGLSAQVASIQTLQRRKKVPDADVIIIDEGHHVQPNNGYGDVLTKYPNALVLALTATPYRLSGDGFTTIFDKLIQAHMPDGTPVDYNYLQSEGFLAKFEYYNIEGFDHALLKLSKGDYTDKSAHEAVRLAPIVETYERYCKGKSGIVFACNVEHSLELQQKYINAGYKAIHIDANTDTMERQKAIEALKQKQIHALINVGIATEGFDAPDIDFVQLTKKTKSLSLYLQMIGRAGRVNNEVIKGLLSADDRLRAIAKSQKPHGIILDNCGNFSEHLEGAEYAMGWRSIDWTKYYQGTKKKKEKQVDEFIEMIIFEAEDESGHLVRSKDIKEIEGMKLVKVCREVAKKTLSLKSIKEFDKQFVLAQRIANVKKVGFFSYYKYKEYCKKNNILMSKEIWQYLDNKLCVAVEEEIKSAKEYEARATEGIKSQYTGQEAQQLYEGLLEQTQQRIERAKLLGVPKGFLRRERQEYFSTLDSREL